MAATVTVMTAFLKAGDHCVLTDCSYGGIPVSLSAGCPNLLHLGTNRAARIMFSDLGIEFSFVDCTNPENVKEAIKPNTKLIFTETPANPTLTLNDIEAISRIAHENKPPIVHVCDCKR